MPPTLFVSLAVSLVLCMIIGSVWYMPKVFGKAWMQDVQLDFATVQKGTMIRAMTISGVLYLLQTAFLWYIYHRLFIAAPRAYFIGVVMMWIVFTLGTRASHSAFEQRSFRYVVITALHDLACLLTAACIVVYLK